MLFKTGLLTASVVSCALISGCSQIPTNMDQQDPIIFGSNQATQTSSPESSALQTQRFQSELSERYGRPVSADENTARTLLAELANETTQRYRSAAPIDTAEFKIVGITLNKSGHEYRLRDLNVIVARGDSRILNTSDLQIRYSGIEATLRLTYALNGTVWINGKQVGHYNPNESNYIDARVPDLEGQGYIYLRATY